MSVEDIVAFNWIQELSVKVKNWVDRTFIPNWENLSNQSELLLSLLANGGQLTNRDIPVKKITIDSVFTYQGFSYEAIPKVKPSGFSGSSTGVLTTRFFNYKNTFAIHNIEYIGDGNSIKIYREFPNWNIISPHIQSYSERFTLNKEYINFQNISESTYPIDEQNIYIAFNGKFALYYDQSSNTFNISKNGIFYKTIFLIPQDVVLGTICDMGDTPLWSNGNLLYSDTQIWYLPKPIKAMMYIGDLYLVPLYGKEIWKCSLS